MKIRFNKSVSYPQLEKGASKTYTAGEVYDLPDDHANRWLRRGVAVEVVETKSAEVRSDPKPEKPAKPARQ